MHEKYFLPGHNSGMRSVEGTPQARRKHTGSTEKKHEKGEKEAASHSRKSHGGSHKDSRLQPKLAVVCHSQSAATAAAGGSDSDSDSSSPVTTSPSR